MKLRNSLLLLITATIWGTAFVAQSAGSGMGAYSFLAGRSWLAVLVLIPTMFDFDAVRKKQGQPYGWPKEKSERKTLLAAGLDSVNISLDTLSPEQFARITARDEFENVRAGIHAALESGLPVKLNCVPQVGVNEGELEDLAALAESRPLQVRFIEMMPIGYGAAMPCISGPELRARFARRWPELAPLSPAQEHALGDGPAVYYTVPGWQGSIGFIAAVHGKFCASCNRVRLTSQGFLRPCLASETGCDLRALLRSGADDAQLLAAIRETIWAKPREHHFNDSSMPATRGMYRIGG